VGHLKVNYIHVHIQFCSLQGTLFPLERPIGECSVGEKVVYCENCIAHRNTLCG